MLFVKIFFWLTFIIIFYNYIGYGLLVCLMVSIKKSFAGKPMNTVEEKPEVTLLVAAYNEAEIIEEKIQNSFELEYPEEKLHIIIITDGSTDNSPQVIENYSRVQLLHQPIRNGKAAALNRAMRQVTTPIVIFCDANTMLNKDAVNRIVTHYSYHETGGVAGEKRVSDNNKGGASGTGEGLYWKYESFLKKLDASLYTIVGAAGELFSIRTALYEQIPEDTLLDDFVISLRITLKGYRIAYEPMAYALEAASADIREERKRKIRICAGGFQAMLRLKSLLNFLKHPLLTFQYFSHRVLRWTLTPLSLPILLVTNALLAIPGNRFYVLFLAAQVVFYLFALLGYYYANRNIKAKWFYVPYYFSFMNLSVYLGFFRFIQKTQTVLWEKAKRGQPA